MTKSWPRIDGARGEDSARIVFLVVRPACLGSGSSGDRRRRRLLQMADNLSPEPAPSTNPWPLVLCLVGVDYFSTLAYLPSIAVEAAGPLRAGGGRRRWCWSRFCWRCRSTGTWWVARPTAAARRACWKTRFPAGAASWWC